MRAIAQLLGHLSEHIIALVALSSARQSTLPVSISHRYEETPEGQLRAQAPEGTLFTGERNSQVGPGQYDPAVGGVRPDPKAAIFGRGPEIDRTAFLLGRSAAPGTSVPLLLCALQCGGVEPDVQTLPSPPPPPPPPPHYRAI